MLLLVCSFALSARGQEEVRVDPLAGVSTWQDFDFSGVTITVAVPEFGRRTIEEAAREFTKHTGGKVEVLNISGAVWREQMLQELVAGTGTFDIMDISPWWFGDFYPYLMPIDSYFADPRFTDPAFDPDDIIPALWDEYAKGPDGNYYGLPFWASVVVNYYRTDLFNDPAEKRAFMSRYGYELAPPVTWDQWLDVAEFFTRPEENLYGATLIGKRAYNINVPITNRFFGVGAPDWIDDEGKPIIFSRPELMEEAFDLYLASAQYAPPDYLATEFFETTNTLISGTVAMAEQWSGAAYFAAQDPTQSSVVGNIAIAPVPGDGALGGGHMWAIAKDTKHPEASWVLLQLLGSKEVVKFALLEEGIDPPRASTYADPDVVAYYPPGYGANLAQALAASYQPILNKTPYSTALWEALIARTSEVISLIRTPKEATDGLIADWRRIIP